MSSVSSAPIDALLLVAPACPHCPKMKQQLLELLGNKKLTSLEIVDISTDLERSEKLGVRSVPWLKLNDIELQGVHTASEIEYWLEQSITENGRLQLFDSLLEVGQLAQVESMLRKHPEALTDLLVLFSDQERQINVRIGASAVLESLEGSGLLEAAVNEISAYTQHSQVSTRIDACHVLSFINHPSAISALKIALNDVDPEVKEVAQDSLDEHASNG